MKKRIFAIIFTALLLWCGVLSTFAAKETKTLAFGDFKSKFDGASVWEATTNGVKSKNKGTSRAGEFFNTDIKVNANEPFTFEADVTIIDGVNGPFAGISLSRKIDSLTGSDGGWYGLYQFVGTGGHVRFASYYSPSTLEVKENDILDPDGSDFGKTHKLRIEYDNNVFTVYYDGKLAAGPSSNSDPEAPPSTGIYTDSGFDGEWYIGVVSTRCDATFENMKLTIGAEDTTTATTTSATTDDKVVFIASVITFMAIIPVILYSRKNENSIFFR